MSVVKAKQIKKIPKKIELCPIHEAILEFRFEPKNKSLTAIELLGYLFPEIVKEFSTNGDKIKSSQLPIADLPEAIRDKDPLFREKPSFKLEIDKYTIQIGARVISILVQKEYVGWDRFSDKINKLLGIIEQAQIIERITRIGFRCINFFEKKQVDDIFKQDKLEIQVQKNSSPLAYKKMSLFAAIEKAVGIQLNISISNNSSIMYKGLPQEGSVIDLDAYINNPNIDMKSFSSSMSETINTIHDSEKETFYDYLSEAFILTLKPTYDK